MNAEKRRTFRLCSSCEAHIEFGDRCTTTACFTRDFIETKEVLPQDFIVLVRKGPGSIDFVRQVDQFEVKLTQKFSLAKKFKSREEIPADEILNSFKEWTVCDL